MRVAIVGSRRREDRAHIDRIVKILPAGTVVISGGCKGVDSWAIQSAQACGLRTQIIMPDLPAKGAPKYEFTRAYYARNEKVAAACDVLIAAVAPDRQGGTENTIAHAEQMGKLVIISYGDDRFKCANVCWDWKTFAAAWDPEAAPRFIRALLAPDEVDATP